MTKWTNEQWSEKTDTSMHDGLSKWCIYRYIIHTVYILYVFRFIYIPIGCMYGVFTYIDFKHTIIHVGQYTIHWSYGMYTHIYLYTLIRQMLLIGAWVLKRKRSFPTYCWSSMFVQKGKRTKKTSQLDYKVGPLSVINGLIITSINGLINGKLGLSPYLKKL